MPSRRARVLIATVIGGALMIFAAGGVSAQRFFREGGFAARYAPAQMPDSSFVICRLAYTQVRREQSGIGWETDYPYAEINLSTRFSELTRTRISRDTDGTPNYYVVRAGDDQLFNCPIIVASDAGTIGFTDAQALRLRQYFMKGGFLWADDFWGSYAWEHWTQEFSKVLPPHEYPIVDLPLDHPLLRAQFEIKHIAQIPSINHWMGSGGGTSERGYDSEVPHARGISDRNGRLMVLITHNTDFGDSWEREADDPTYFYRFSVDGYAFGINVFLYALTH
jgi:hypothetical protein